jgi:hypothetical protein
MSNRPNSSVSRSVSSFNDATSQENLQSEEKKPSIFMRIINSNKILIIVINIFI